MSNYGWNRVSVRTLRPGDLIRHRFAHWGDVPICIVVSTHPHQSHVMTAVWPDFSGMTLVCDMYGATHSVSHYNWEGMSNTVELLSRAGEL